MGEQRPIKVDVRIIAATNSELEKMVEEGRFREDLYYRLNVIRLRVPPLRERRSEIPNIVNYYVDQYAEKFGRKDIEITPQAVDLLMVCDWPGNVRQLCNELQRLVARAEDGTLITPDQLSLDLLQTVAHSQAPASVTQINGSATQGIRNHSGNISRAARELGLTRRGLIQLKLGRYELSASA